MKCISLVIPCFNEGENLSLLIPRCGKLVSSGEVEVIFVDNGSTDMTPEILKALLPSVPGCRAIRVETNRGYGFGILSGLRVAKGELLGWSHADMQTDPLDVKRGLELFRSYGADIFVKGRRYGRRKGDVFFTVGMSIFEMALLGKSMWDINAQPTLFNRKFYEAWYEPPLDFSLDLYAFYFAKKLGLPVHRFPVRFGERAHGVSHWNINWSAKRKFIQRTAKFSLQLKKTFKK